MKEYAASPRVEKLRREARAAVEIHTMDLYRERRDDGKYCWDDRQLYHFYKAWLRHPDAPTVLQRRVLAEAEMIAEEPVILSGEDLICGRPDVNPLSGTDAEEYRELRNHFLDLVPFTPGRLGHMALDYEKLLKLGIEGLLQEIAGHRTALTEDDLPEYLEKCEFYDCCEIQLKAVLTLADRYAAYAEQNGMTEQAKLLRRVPRYPAVTFHEALQSIHFYTFILRDLFSCGRPDQYLIDYYRRDLAAGILTEEQALEIIDCFNLQYTFYTRPLAAISYIVGGQTADGTPVENELTWLFLQSISHVKLAYPGVGLAVGPDTRDEILDYALKLLATGHTHPALFNDVALPASLKKIGIAEQDARLYIHSTCVETTPCGCSGIWATSPYYSCPGILMDLLKEKQDFADLDSLKQAYYARLNQIVKAGQREQDIMQMERSRNGGESMLASCLVADCLARGKSLDNGGARYNYIFPDFIGATNTVDSFAAIGKLVFEEKRLTLSQLMGILQNNFAGQEPLRQYIVARCPHFGNNQPDTDALAVEFYRQLSDSCRGLMTYRGSTVHPGAFAFMMHEEYGKICMATPDGRLAGEAFNGGSDPVSGRDISGPTATVLSDTVWNQIDFPGGIAVNLRLNTAGLDEAKLAVFRTLVRTFMEKGGMELQINSVSPEVLQDAMDHPEKHGDLLVRIGGYSDYFVRISPELQREILARSYHTL